MKKKIGFKEAELILLKEIRNEVHDLGLILDDFRRAGFLRELKKIKNHLKNIRDWQS